MYFVLKILLGLLLVFACQNLDTDSQFRQVVINDTSDDNDTAQSPIPFHFFSIGVLVKPQLVQLWFAFFEYTNDTVNNGCIPQTEQQRANAFLSGECYLLLGCSP